MILKQHRFWSEFPEMENRLKKISEYFIRIMDDTPALIREDLKIMFETPGKMLRPAFVLMSASSGSRVSDNLYPVAAAVELLHSATLVHDDIIDYSPERRGRPSLHSRMGIKRAVLAGDYLLAKAMELASGAHKDGLVEAVNTAVSRLCLSEIDQDSGQGQYFIDRETYYRRINGKTAELFALSCKVGAVLGGSGNTVCDTFYNIGKNFGTAFQIYDDVLDYTGSADKTGKPPGNDLKDGIPTLPLILALENGDRALERLCRSRFRLKRAEAIRRKVISGGFTRKAADIGDSFFTECIEDIETLDFPDRELFVSVIKKLKNSYESVQNFS